MIAMILNEMPRCFTIRCRSEPYWTRVYHDSGSEKLFYNLDLVTERAKSYVNSVKFKRTVDFLQGSAGLESWKYQRTKREL